MGVSQSMEGSIWSATLVEFREKTAGMDPVPAGVAVSAVTASLALALLVKVLEITRGRKTFAGDTQKIEALIEAARRESVELARLADEDMRVFNSYMDSVRLPKTPERERAMEAAMRAAIRVPMDAARSAVRGLDFCKEASAIGVTGLTGADLGAAVALLSGAVDAVLLSVESNLRETPASDPYCDEVSAELSGLRAQMT
jgi:formiminotetrahydrofolate cyclodeaminase